MNSHSQKFRENSARITSLLSDIAAKGNDIRGILVAEEKPTGLRCRDLDNQFESYVHYSPAEGISASFVGSDGRRYRVSVVPEKHRKFWQLF